MQIAGVLVSTNNPGGCSTQSVSWCMEWRDGIEIKRGREECQLRVLNLRKYWLPFKLTWAVSRRGVRDPPGCVNINIPDKYSCPGVQTVVTKWGSWVDVLFMMVMIIMLHKKEISISHYLSHTRPPHCIFSLSLRNISRSDSYSIWKNNFYPLSLVSSPLTKFSWGYDRAREGLRLKGG